MIPEESWPIICFGGTLHLDIVIQMSASPSLSAPAPFLGDLVKPSPNPKLMSLDLQKPFSGFLGARAPCFPPCLPALRVTWNDSGSSPSIASIKKKKNLFSSSSSGFRQLSLRSVGLVVFRHLPQSTSILPLLILHCLGTSDKSSSSWRTVLPSSRDLEYLAVLCVLQWGFQTNGISSVKEF